MPKETTNGTQSKYWCFTINNPGETKPEQCIPSEERDYLIYQPEVGENGTSHLQGYVCMKKKKKLSTMKKYLPTAHLETRKGTHIEAKEYCQKLETRDGLSFFEFGTDKEIPTTKGERNDLSGMKELIDKGGNLVDCFENYFGSTMRYHKGLTLYMNLKNPPRHEMPKVYVFWGKTGTGKSKAAFELCKPEETYYKMPDNKWWDGYDPRVHKNIIIDDFRGQQLNEEYLLRLCDRYPMKVEVKGGTVDIKFQKIIFTSNLHPKDWSCWGMGWEWEYDHPFKRRIFEEKEFKVIEK